MATREQKDRIYKAFYLTGDTAKCQAEIEKNTQEIDHLEAERIDLQQKLETSQRVELDIANIKVAYDL